MNFKRILNEILNHIADFYFYFLVFYVFSLILSLFFESWKLFFYWPAFHISVIAFGILSLLSEKGRQEISNLKSQISKIQIKNKIFHPADKISKFEIPKIKIPKLDFSKSFSVFTELKNLIPKFLKLLIEFYKLIKTAGAIFKIVFIFLTSFLISLFQIFIFFVYGQMRKLTKNDFIKIGAMAAILGFALYERIDVIDFVILAYGAISVLFIMESRISALMALAFLIFVPIFLILENTIFAEKMAVFAYYFLVIAVLTQIREYSRENSLPDGRQGKQKLSTNI